MRAEAVRKALRDVSGFKVAVALSITSLALMSLLRERVSTPDSIVLDAIHCT
jgi:hypothetical protein